MRKLSQKRPLVTLKIIFYFLKALKSPDCYPFGSAKYFPVSINLIGKLKKTYSPQPQLLINK